MNVRREVSVVVLAFAAFPLVAFLQPGTPSSATSRGERFARLETSWGGLRRHLYSWTTGHELIQSAAEVFYYSAHVTVLIGVGIVTAVGRPAAYRNVRTIFLVAHLMTIGCYLALPTAPPRLLPPLDTGGSGPWTNVQYEYAAFPSGHVVFALVVSIALLGSSTRCARIGGVVYPLVVGVVTLATNNHHIIDLVGAAVVVGASTVLVSCRHIAVERYTRYYLRSALREFGTHDDPKPTLLRSTHELTGQCSDAAETIGATTVQ